MKISIFHSALTNPALPPKIAGAAESGVVIGSDFARTHQLAFILSVGAPTKRGWEGFSLAELAIHKKQNVIGAKDYIALLTLQRQIAVSDIRGMRARLADLPKSDELLRRRRALPVSALNPTEPATAVIKGVESFLRRSGYSFVDNAIQNLSELAPGRLPFRTIPTLYSTHLLLLVTSGITYLEAALIGKYLSNPDEFLIRKITVIVEDSTAWDRVKQSVEPYAQFEEETVDPCADLQRLVNYGHLPWDTDTLLGHAKRLRTLAVARGLSIIAVTQTKADTCALLMRLVELGVPVHCSQSALVVMRPGIFTLMSFISLARGIAPLPALVRLMDSTPNVGAREFDHLYDVLKTPGGTTQQCLKEMGVLIAHLGALSREQSDAPDEVLLKTKASMPVWAPSKDCSDIDEYWPALAMWASRFTNINQMLIEFWRLRVLLSGWTGYRPDSGIEVTETLPSPQTTKMLVLIRPEEAMTQEILWTYQTNSLIKAPIVTSSLH